MIDNYEKIFKRDGWLCQQCGQSVTLQGGQLAHKIANTKCNKKKYGKDIINHSLNLVLTCSLECNAKCNIGNRPERCKELVIKIRDNINE